MTQNQLCVNLAGVDEEETFQMVWGNALEHYGIETDSPKTYQELVASTQR